MHPTEERFVADDGLELYARHVEPANPAEPAKPAKPAKPANPANLANPAESPSEPPRGRVVVVHGYGEHSRRYDELVGFLSGRGYACSAFDARGHGRSGGQRGYVQSFDVYVHDLSRFVERVRRRSDRLPITLLAHSNGGLISVRALQAGAVRVEALVVTNPLIALRPRRRPVPDVVARALSACLPRLPLPNGVRPSYLTHDRACLEALRTDRWVTPWATPRWYWSMTLAGREALARAGEIALPLLLVRGSADPLVDADVAGEFFERVGSRDKRLVTREGELHEVLNEVRRRELFGIVADWLDERGPPRRSGT